MRQVIKKSWPILAFILFAALIWTNIYLATVKEAQAEPLDTYHSSWHVIRATAAEDGANFAAVYDLAGDEGNFANKGAAAFRIFSRSQFGAAEGYSPGSRWMFAICGTHDDGDTFSFNVVGWAKTNGMLQMICEGNGLLGKQDVVIQPDGTVDPNGFWADTIALDDTKLWPGLYNDANDGIIVRNSGNDQVAILVIETTGLEWIQFVVYDAAGTAEAASITVYGRRY